MNFSPILRVLFANLASGRCDVFFQFRLNTLRTHRQTDITTTKPNIKILFNIYLNC